MSFPIVNMWNKKNDVRLSDNSTDNHYHSTSLGARNDVQKIQTLNTKKEKDIYTVLDFPNEKETFGRFKGNSPKRAAMKAFTRLAKISKLNNTDRQFIVFSILNLNNEKEYKYIGTRVKLIKPRVVNRGGKKIVYKYVNTVGKYKEVLNKIK